MERLEMARELAELNNLLSTNYLSLESFEAAYNVTKRSVGCPLYRELYMDKVISDKIVLPNSIREDLNWFIENNIGIQYIPQRALLKAAKYSTHKEAKEAVPELFERYRTIRNNVVAIVESSTGKQFDKLLSQLSKMPCTSFYDLVCALGTPPDTVKELE